MRGSELPHKVELCLVMLSRWRSNSGGQQSPIIARARLVLSEIKDVHKLPFLSAAASYGRVETVTSKS